VKNSKPGSAMLHVASGLSLPIKYGTGTAAVLGKKRVGKTYKASVIAEELCAHNHQIVVIDPTSAWWGLRSSKDGDGNGFPIAIFGGEHGDMPLDPNAGAEIARAVVHERFSLILDLDGFTKGEETRFAAAFLETIYREKRGKHRTPLHLFLDEADIYAPQKPYGDDARVLGACDSLVRRGGIKGIGVTLITQRPAVINKNVLTQVDTLVALSMSHPADLDPIKDWVGVHGDVKAAKRMFEELPSLPRGEAWVWSPHQDIFARVTFRDRHTFDSGRTPEAGDEIEPPKILAPVDIERIGMQIRELAAHARAEDPKHLHKRIRELEADNAQLKSAPASQVVKTIEVPAIRDEQIVRLAEIARDVKQAATDIYTASLPATWASLTTLSASCAPAPHVDPVVPEHARNLRRHRVQPTTKISSPAEAVSAPKNHRAARAGQLDPFRTKDLSHREDEPTPAGRSRVPSLPEGVPKKAISLIQSLAWWESIGLSEIAIAPMAFVAGYTVNGHFNNMRGKLRGAGLIEYLNNNTTTLTAQGRRFSPSSFAIDSLDTLHAKATSRLKSKMGLLLTQLLQAYPDAMASEEWAEATGYTVNGHFNNMRGALKRLGLVEYVGNGKTRACDWLFPDGVQ
jgi:hypothetical protein